MLALRVIRAGVCHSYSGGKTKLRYTFNSTNRPKIVWIQRSAFVWDAIGSLVLLWLLLCGYAKTCKLGHLIKWVHSYLFNLGAKKSREKSHRHGRKNGVVRRSLPIPRRNCTRLYERIEWLKCRWRWRRQRWWRTAACKEPPIYLCHGYTEYQCAKYCTRSGYVP